MGQLQSAYVTSQRLVLLLQGTPNATGPYTGGPFAWIDFVEDIPPSTKSVAQFRADYKCDFWDAL